MATTAAVVSEFLAYFRLPMDTAYSSPADRPIRVSDTVYAHPYPCITVLNVSRASWLFVESLWLFLLVQVFHIVNHGCMLNFLMHLNEKALLSFPRLLSANPSAKAHFNVSRPWMTDFHSSASCY